MTDEAVELSTRCGRTSDSSRLLRTSSKPDGSSISQHNDATNDDQIKPLPASDSGSGDQVIKADDRLSILVDVDLDLSEFTTDR